MITTLQEGLSDCLNQVEGHPQLGSNALNEPSFTVIIKTANEGFCFYQLLIGDNDELRADPCGVGNHICVQYALQTLRLRLRGNHPIRAHDG